MPVPPTSPNVPPVPPSRPVFPIDTSLEGKALIASRSPWGVLAFYVVSFLIAKFGFHADDQTMAIISGIFVLIGGYVVRLITHKPITGIVAPGDKPLVPENPVAGLMRR